MLMPMSKSDPHANQPIATAGPPPRDADAAIVLVHGRGASADDMLSLYEELGVETVAAIAPQAEGSTWYPQSFLAPIEANQPYLDSALARIESIIAGLIKDGVSSQRIML